jgi:hypothetical protein
MVDIFLRQISRSPHPQTSEVVDLVPPVLLNDGWLSELLPSKLRDVNFSNLHYTSIVL